MGSWRALNILGGGILLLIIFSMSPSSLFAEINDYQIRRLILYKTDCQFVTYNKSSFEDGSVNYSVSCENLSFYPDGVLISCNDMEDETSCEVKTQSQTYDYLEMLRQE